MSQHFPDKMLKVQPACDKLVYQHQDNYEVARRHFEEGLILCHSQKYFGPLSECLTALAGIAADEHQPALAVHAVQQRFPLRVRLLQFVQLLLGRVRQSGEAFVFGRRPQVGSLELSGGRKDACFLQHRFDGR